MKRLVLAVLVAFVLLIVAGPSRADVTSGPAFCGNFTPTPVASGDVPFQGCSAVITFNADGSVSVDYFPQGDTEDMLVGVINNSGHTVNSVNITGAEPFDFDGDFNLSKGATGYEGPGTTFTVDNISSGRVNFTDGLADGGKLFFGLEGAPNAENLQVPEPSSLLLLSAGGLFALLLAGRKLVLGNSLAA